MGRPKGSINRNLTDLAGKVFGAFEVLYEAARRKNNARVWMCRCKCGTEMEVYQTNLIIRPNGMCRNCMFESRQKSEMHKSLRTVYEGMIGRCYSDSDPDRYAYYGGRGIKVCDRWLEESGKGFQNFWEDMGDRPEGATLDRIDPNGDYCKENCQWVNKTEQSFNRRKGSNNTSGRTGVYWDRRLEKWYARIAKEGQHFNLGFFDSFEDAVKAREEAELKHYGYIKE